MADSCINNTYFWNFVYRHFQRTSYYLAAWVLGIWYQRQTYETLTHRKCLQFGNMFFFFFLKKIDILCTCKFEHNLWKTGLNHIGKFPLISHIFGQFTCVFCTKSVENRKVMLCLEHFPCFSHIAFCPIKFKHLSHIALSVVWWTLYSTSQGHLCAQKGNT